jgi:Xaa-Pro aminopeptidase
MSAKRIDAARKILQSENLDGLIVTDKNQVLYLTGFYGHEDLDSILVVVGKRAHLVTDSRYTDEAKRTVKGARVHTAKGSKLDFLKDIKELTGKNLRFGYHAGTMTVAVMNQIGEKLPGWLMISAEKVFAELGWVKDKDELISIRKAVDISDIAFERILNLVAPGIRERELAAELEYQMMMLGSEKPAFETIVASGHRSAMPHGLASAKKLKKGDFVTFDFGACVKGYVSDITRTVVVGKATSRQKKIYGVVLRAQKAGVRKMKPGVTGKAVDGVCRKIITNAGYGKKFGHGTGHGISIEVHSGPRLSPISEDKLQVGNVITVEPGIYISGWGGVRIEDDVLVTRGGSKALNQAPKKLLEL